MVRKKKSEDFVVDEYVGIHENEGVGLMLSENGKGCLFFVRPATKAGVKHKKEMPPAKTIRTKNALLTAVSVSWEVLAALKKLLQNKSFSKHLADSAEAELLHAVGPELFDALGKLAQADPSAIPL